MSVILLWVPDVHSCPCAGCCEAQAWQQSQLCLNMDKSLVNVLRSVRADSGEQADEFTEVQDILMRNRI